MAPSQTTPCQTIQSQTIQIRMVLSEIENSGSVQQTVAQLQKNCLIKIYIKSEPTPYLIQASLFNIIFSCQKAFNSKFQSRNDKLTYHLDSVWKAEWEILLFWIVHQKPLLLVDSLILQECWILGGKYNIPAFQDAAMVGVLLNLEKTSLSVDPQELANIYYCNPHSKLRELLVEELVKSLYHYNKEPEDMELDDLEGVDGLMKGLVKTHKRFIKDKDSFFNRFTKRPGKEKARWEDFMVSEGTKIIYWGNDATAESVRGKRKASEVE